LWSSIALGQGLYSLGQHDNAVAVFKQAHLAGFLYHIGYSMQIEKNWSAAIQIYELSLEVQPTKDVIDRLIELYTLWNNSKAIRCMWDRIISNPETSPVEYWRAIGELSVLNTDWDGAIHAYKQALAQPNQSTAVQYDLDLRLAQICQKIRRYAEALQIYQDAIHAAPAITSEPYRAIGEILAIQGDDAGSANWFDKARQVFPRDPLPDIHQGVVAVKLGKLDEAKRKLYSALAISPHNVQALVELGKLEEQQDNLENAIMYLEQANDPPNCDVAPLLQEFYRKQGVLDKLSILGEQVTHFCPP
jgi:tetratricopeptide (TPR) repeat protein